MLISEATDSIKRFCNQETAAGGAMDPAMSRDHVLWGDVDRACTGIFTCIWHRRTDVEA